MADFLNIVSSFPTVVFTVLLGVIFLYWLLAILGAVDIDMLDLDVDVDADASGVGGLTGLLSTLGLSGPPVTVILSVLVVLSWLFSYFASAYLLVLVPWDMFREFIGAGLLVGCFVVAIPVTAQVIKPLKGLFIVHSAKSKSHFIGATCKITTLEVTDKFGQGLIDDGEAGIIVSVRANTPNSLKKGGKAKVVSYDKEKGTYEVVPEENCLE
ncbi:MAG: ubiquinone biosynthesis protein [Gammaproteobacteria bacterium]